MIKKFRHRGLEALFRKGRTGGVNPQHVEKIRRILARLDVAARASDMDLPGWRLHPLKGVLAGFWSVTVNANWRIIFRFEKDDVTDLDYVDYH
jgi:proteic killer suppression protein